MAPERSPASVGASTLRARGNANSTWVLLVAVGSGLAIGIATSVGQGWLPDGLTPLSNSSGSGCLCAVALALLERDPRRAAGDRSEFRVGS